MAVNLSFIGGAGWQFFDDNGTPLSGGKIYTYVAGTTTPLATYTSRDGLTPNTNPIILDAAGRTPQEIWSTEGLLYKYVVKTSTDTLIRSWDNIGGSVVASNLAQDLANTTDNAKGDDLIGFKQSNSAGFLTGATARTVNSKLQEIVSILDFGADPTTVNDSTTAIQAAIDATPYGGTLHIPAGSYRVTSGLIASQPIRIIGDGLSSSTLAIPPTVPNTVDILTFKGFTGGPSYEGYYLSDIKIAPISGTPARHGLVIEGGINRFTVERIYIGQFTSYGFWNKGGFSSTVQNSSITGMLYDKCTDNQNILNNTIRGVDWGVYIDAVVGTNMFNITGNVIVNERGGVYAKNVGTLTISDNQFEAQVTNGYPHGDPNQLLDSIVYIEGVSWQVPSTMIYGNSFNASPDFVTSTIVLKSTVGAQIFGNRFTGGISYPNSIVLNIRPEAINTIVGQNFCDNTQLGYNQFASSQILLHQYNATYFPEGRILDAGKSTCGVWQLLPMGSADITQNFNYNLLAYRKDTTSNLRLVGGVNVASPTTGKVITTLPQYARPPDTVTYNVFTATTRNPATNAYGTTPIRILNDGAVILPEGASLPNPVEVSLDGITLPFYY
jgi:hypothetical protein